MASLKSSAISAIAIGAAAICILAGCNGGNDESGGFGGNGGGGGTTGSPGTDLGAVAPFSIDNLGFVIADTNPGTVVFHHGISTTLDPGGGGIFIANQINDSGMVAGAIQSSAGNTSAAVYKAGVFTTLKGVPNETQSMAIGVNSNSQIVGWIQRTVSGGGDATAAAYWASPTSSPLLLNSLNPDAATQNDTAQGINDAGLIVGNDEIPTGTPRYEYFTAQAGSATVTDMNQSVNVPSGGGAINQNDFDGFVSQNGLITFIKDASGGGYDLWETTLGGMPKMIISNFDSPFPFIANKAGQVPGASGNVAVIYDPGAGVVDLNTFLPSPTSWHLTAAASINDMKQVAGVGTVNGSSHGFVMTLPNTLHMIQKTTAIRAASAVKYPLSRQPRGRARTH